MIRTEETQEQLKKANTVTNAVLGKGSGKSFLRYLCSNTHDGTDEIYYLMIMITQFPMQIMLRKNHLYSEGNRLLRL